MRTVFFIPPLRSVSGGLAVILALARILHEAGFPVLLAPRERGGPAETSGLPLLHREALQLGPEDIWFVPEGWVNALAPGLRDGARCVVYCQNWAYLFSSLPPGLDWRSLPVSFVAVSQPVAWFIAQALGFDAPILRPGIDLTLFRAPEAKPAGPVRVAWMPRKNRALAREIRDVFEARSRGTEAVEWVEISGQDRAGVASLLATAHVFLVTGFPEGCPLPPLEAMACGALPVGFSGFGGWDYMRQAWNDGLGAGFVPWWPLRSQEEISWSGNGLWVADADVPAAALALEQAVTWWRAGDARLEQALRNAAATAAGYSLAAQRDQALALWQRAARGDIFTRSSGSGAIPALDAKESVPHADDGD